MNFQFLSRDVEVTLETRLFGPRVHESDSDNWTWSVKTHDAICSQIRLGDPPIKENTRHVTIVLVMLSIRFHLEICVPLRQAVEARGHGDNGALS